MLEFLHRLDPIGNAVILIICCFPLAVTISVLKKPKAERSAQKSQLVASIALLIIGFLVVYFRS